MAVVTIQEHDQTQGGAQKVKASGKWFFLNRNLDKPPIGSTVEIREGSFGTPPKTTIEAWRPVGGNGTAPQQNASAPAAPPAGYVDEAQMRFISNCVGSAITSGTIKEPAQILPWFQAAKAAIEGKKPDIPFSDNLPPSMPSDDRWGDAR